MDDKLIEYVAKAIAEVTADWPWSLWTDEARAAIAAIEVDHVILTKAEAANRKPFADWILKP